jgi:hypothetical protein
MLYIIIISLNIVITYYYVNISIFFRYLYCVFINEFICDFYLLLHYSDNFDEAKINFIYYYIIELSSDNVDEAKINFIYYYIIELSSDNFDEAKINFIYYYIIELSSDNFDE